MIIRITTRNSVYDVDVDGKRVRRVMGAEPPTERQGQDMLWQNFVELWMQDGGIVFQWGWNEDGSKRCTWTSDVLHAEEIKEIAGAH